MSMAGAVLEQGYELGSHLVPWRTKAMRPDRRDVCPAIVSSVRSERTENDVQSNIHERGKTVIVFPQEIGAGFQFNE